MALFSITNRQTGDFMVIRANCMTDVRNIAVASAGAEGTIVWRNPEKSKVQLIEHEGKRGLILRSEDK